MPSLDSVAWPPILRRFAPSGGDKPPSTGPGDWSSDGPGERSDSRILIVDDDAAFRYLLERDLNRRGYAVETVAGSLEALDLLDQGRAYDLIVIDLRLSPGEPHGFAFGRMASLKSPDAPRLYVTAADLGDVRMDEANAPVVQKSGSLEQITGRIRDLLQSG